MEEMFGNVPIWLGLGGILISLLFWKFLPDKQHFRYTFLVSHLLIAIGLMSQKHRIFWVGFLVFLLWFAAAFYVIRKERGEKKLSR